MSSLTERLDQIEAQKKAGSAPTASAATNRYASGGLTARLDRIQAEKEGQAPGALSGLAQFGIEVDDTVLQRAKDNYAKTFKSDYDLDYDMERRANGLMPKSYDKKYDSASALDRYLYENNLPDSKKFAEYYNKAADELNKERETERKEQEKLLKEQAPQRQYQSLYNEIGKDLTPYMDLETGELSEEKILDFVYGKFGEEGYAELADAWKQYKDDEDYDTHEEMLIAQAAQNDPNTYNIKRLMDELNEGRREVKNRQAAELAEETGIGTAEIFGLYGMLPMADSSGATEKNSGTERPNIPILNSPALGGTGETTTMADIEEAEERKAEREALEAVWAQQDDELRAAIDTSGQRHLPGGLGATVEQIFNEDIQAQVDAYIAAADAEGKWTPFEVDQALRRANLDMYLHRDGKSFSDREVKNYAIATLQASGMTPEQAEDYFANMTDGELKTFEADMAFDSRVHADTSQEFGEALVSIPVRAVVNTWAGMVGLADMVAGVVDSDRDLWDYTKKMQAEAAKWQQYGHSERHESLNVISDVGSELLRMYALHLAGVGLASHAAGAGGLTAASLTTAQKGTGAILSAFAKGVRASAGSAPFVANAMGGYFTQAMQSGATRQQATGFAVFAGVMEGALESFGADAMFNKALSARMVKRMTLGAKGALTSPAAFKFVQVATSAIGNGMEEGASYILAGLGEMAFFNKNWRPDAGEFMDNMKMGFIVGSLGAMAGSASDSRAYAIYQQMLDEGYSPQLLDAGVFAAQVEAMPKAKVEARVQNAMELTQEEYVQAVFEHSKAVQDVQDITDQHDRQVAAANERVSAAQATLDNLIARKDALDPYNPKDAVALTQVCKEIASAKLTLQKTIESAEAAKQTAGKEFKSALANAQRRADISQRQLDDHAIAYDLRMQQMMARQDIDRSIAELNDIEAQEVAIYERLANTTDISEIQALEQMLESFDERRDALNETIDEGIHTEEWLAMENKQAAEAWANDAEWQQTLQAYAEDRAARETAQGPVQTGLNTEEAQAAVNGRATVIKHPYAGDTPKRIMMAGPSVVGINPADLEIAKQFMQEGGSDDKSARANLKRKYKELLGDRFSNRLVTVNGTYFNGEPYAVKVYSNLIGKVISDRGLTAEKLSVLNSLEEVIENAEYVGSGVYDAAGKKTKDVVRYDYFETPVEIGGEEYVAALNVEARNVENRFRTYRLESIELHPAGVPRTGPVPASFAQSDAVPAMDIIAESAERMQEPDLQNLGIISQDVQQAFDAVRRTGKRVYQTFVSGQAPLERIGKKQTGIANGKATVTDLLQMARAAKGGVEHILFRGLTDRNGNDLGKGSWKDLVESMPKGEAFAEFQDYLLNLHNIDRMSLEERGYGKNKPVLASDVVDPDGNPIPLTAIESERKVFEYERDHPEFKQIADNLNSWWDTFMRRWAVNGELLSEGAYDDMRDMYSHYVPTYRVEEGNAGPSSSRRGTEIGVADATRRAKGSLAEVKDIRDTFADIVNKIVVAERKNEVLLSLYNYAEQYPEAAAADGVMVRDKDGNVPEMDFDTFDNLEQETFEQTKDGRYLVHARSDGEVVTMQVSEDVFKAIDLLMGSTANDSTKAKEQAKVWQALRNAGNFIKGGITTYSPFFGITNAVRDFQTSFVNSEAGALEYFGNIGNAVSEIATKGEHWKNFQALGGKSSGYVGSQTGFMKDAFSEPSLGRRFVQGFKDTMSWTGEQTESIFRFAEYLQGIKQYGDTPDGRRKAIQMAADVSVNFSRSAPVTKMLDSFTLYLNAQVQGIDKLARQIKNKPLQTLGKNVPFVALAALLLKGLGNEENPHYQNLSNYVKDSNYLIPNPFGERDSQGFHTTFIKLPKSREYGAMIVALFERAARLADGESFESAFADWLPTVATNFAPGNPITENMFTPATVFKTNKNYYGGDVVPTYTLDDPVTEQYDAQTSMVARRISEALYGMGVEASPMHIDYVINQYGGFYGGLLTSATAGDSGGLGRALVNTIEDKFIADPLYSSGATSRFYDVLDEALAASETAKERRGEIGIEVKSKDELAYEDLKAAKGEISNLRKEERELIASMKDSPARKKQIDEIRRKINDIAKTAVEEWERVS